MVKILPFHQGERAQVITNTLTLALAHHPCYDR